MDAIAGKVALITGAATGIGAAYVKRLFKSGLKGCTIADIDDRGGQLAEEMNSCYGKDKAIFIKSDMSDKDAFECAFHTNMKKFDQLNLVINNAGIAKDKTFEKLIDLNATATVRGSLLAIKYMGKNNGACGGTVVNTSSILGLQGMPGAPGYTGTKHFVIGFTRSIGSKFWFDLTGVRFMTICPGVTITPMVTEAGTGVFDGFPGLAKVLTQGLKSAPSQTVDDLAEGLVTMLNEGENGSIWVSEGATPIYEVIIPRIHDMKISAKQC